ncbi:GntR family transcriptional regulator [Microbacteriaceae bacterium VKM Ac-2854]|nr:GntR family transcriptional regulator [Microbacteriaceae bacterium VKM Ac-2854]
MPGQEEHPRSVPGSAHGRQTSSRRVRDLVHASIRAGIYPEHETLAEDTLVHTLSASRSAVRRALQSLAEQGLMIRKPRMGTFPAYRGVSLDLRDVVDGEPERFSLDIIAQREVESFPLIRTLLALDEQHVRMMENLFLHDGLVIGVRTAYFPRRYTSRGMAGPLTMREVGRQVFGTDELRIATTEIGSTIADETTSHLLGIDAGAPVLTRHQVFVGPDGTPIQIVFDHYRADRVSFRMLGDTPTPQEQS